MVPEIEEAVYGGGILGGYLRVFRGFAGGQEHSFHHGKNGMAVVGLAHVFQAGEVEEREQLFERVFRLAILEEAFHIEDTEEGFRLGLGELSCGAEELGLLPCPGAGCSGSLGAVSCRWRCLRRAVSLWRCCLSRAASIVLKASRKRSFHAAAFLPVKPIARKTKPSRVSR